MDNPNRGVDENFNNFYNVFIIYYIAYDCLPITTKQVSNRRVKNPWITSGILTSIWRKITMYRDYMAGLITKLQYKTFNNRVDALTRRTKKEYYIREL